MLDAFKFKKFDKNELNRNFTKKKNLKQAFSQIKKREIIFICLNKIISYL